MQSRSAVYAINLKQCNVSTVVLQEFTPDKIGFLSALPPLISRLAAKDLDTLTTLLEEKARPWNPNQNEVAWEPYFELLTVIKDRGTKAKPKSALKQPGSSGKKLPASATRPQRRK